MEIAADIRVSPHRLNHSITDLGRMRRDERSRVTGDGRDFVEQIREIAR